MAIVTGIGPINFNLLDEDNIRSFESLLFSNAASIDFVELTATVTFEGPFDSSLANEDSITRVVIDTGMGPNAVIDNVGLTDIRVIENQISGTQRELVEFILRGDDTFNLSPGSDLVDGFDGDDNIRAAAGDDTVYGSNGEDTLRGGPGEDVLKGGNGNDSLLGQADDDGLNGGPGEDVLKGGGGADWMSGNADDDFLKGGTEADVIFGGDGNDKLAGNAGNDQLIGGRGSDLLNGGGGFDTLLGGRGNDTYKGGPDNDRFYFANNHGRDVILDFDANSDTEVIGFVFNDDINSFSDVQDGMSQVGDDVLIVTGSNSSIVLRDVDVVDLDANDFIF